MIEFLAVISSLVVSSAVLGAPGGEERTEGGIADGGGACEPAWVSEFGGKPGVLTETLYVMALAVFDDGTGPALFVAGSFTSAGGVAANRIAKWDGQKWTALGSGANNTVRALAVHDDGLGGGPALYAGGSFTNMGGVAVNRVARWNGSTWSALGEGVSGGSNVVYSLCDYDDPSLARRVLVAGGNFTSAGGQSASRIARWNGSTWMPLGQGVNNVVRAMVVHDDGSGEGPQLIVGGAFSTAGGQAANKIARWSGTSWSVFGGGVQGAGDVLSFSSWNADPEQGASLIAGGTFSSIGGVAANRIATWNGSTWSALGQGMGGIVHAVLGVGGRADAAPSVYAGGSFVSAGGTPVSCIARWDGTSWFAMGSGLNEGGIDLGCRTLVEFDDGSGAGRCVYAGGNFNYAGELGADSVAKWDGAAWQVLGSGVDDEVRAVAVFDDGTGDGPRLFAGGSFTTASGISISRIAKWMDGTWEPLGSGVTGGVQSMMVFDDGATGIPALFVGGGFDTAGGVPALNIAKWDGSTWSPLGGGLDGSLAAMQVFDDGRGDGPALYVVGGFSSAGGVPALRVARWDGTEWTALGSGLDAYGYAARVFNDGTGPALYVAGSFTQAGGITANRIARWDGRTWSAVGEGMNNIVWALEVFDDGSGPALYAGGSFSMADGAPASRIAKWTGTAWVPVGGGISGTGPSVRAMIVHDDGSGPSLFVGGSFQAAGGAPSSGVARWDGTTWHSLDLGVGGVWCFATYDADAPGGAALAVGGGFSHSPVGDSFIARWDGCSTIVGDINGDGDVDGDDLVVVLGQWGTCTLCAGDLNRDGIVNGVDLSIVLGSWAP